MKCLRIFWGRINPQKISQLRLEISRWRQRDTSIRRRIATGSQSPNEEERKEKRAQRQEDGWNRD